MTPFYLNWQHLGRYQKNLTQINNTTQANILIGDIFQNRRASQYDAVLMNPPFLRNDNPDTPITAADKAKMVASIQATGVNCFVTNASQPNLYFYFTNYIWHYLRNDGKAGIILMAKFLNNEDAEHLKDFFIDKVETIISYPRKYFQEFVVTTVIVILKKGNNSPNVSFVRIADENVLLNPDSVKAILNINQDTITASYKLKVVPRNTLVASENWSNHLHDQKYDDFLSLNFLNSIDRHFADVSRGGSESNGASTIIYPELDANTNQYFGWGERLSAAQRQTGVQRIRINIPIALNGRIGYGIQNNFITRNYILSVNDIDLEKAFHFPAKSERTTANALSANLQGDAALVQFYNDGINEYGLAKWRRVVNNSFNNTFVPKILIPRADRTKHVVYYNPHNHNLTLSTNFFYCNDLHNQNPAVNNELQYKFISAFLLSAFGQIQFELNANNQEGLRKLELFQMKRFKIPDLTTITPNEINNIVAELDALNAANVEFSGDEGINTPRRNLDTAIGNIFFSRNSLGFANANAMVDYFELFLADLVEDRRI